MQTSIISPFSTDITFKQTSIQEDFYVYVNNKDNEKTLNKISALSECEKKIYEKRFNISLNEDDLLLKVNWNMEEQEYSDVPDYVPLKILKIIPIADEAKFSIDSVQGSLTLYPRMYSTRFAKSLNVSEPYVINLKRLILQETAKASGNHCLAKFYEELPKQINNLWGKVPAQETAENYFWQRKIDTGGQGIIFEVTAAKTQRVMALKLCYGMSACSGDLIPFLQYLSNNETPHLTPIEDTFAIAPESHLFNNSSAHQTRWYDLRCYTMELMEGDLGNSIPMIDEYRVQKLSIEHILNRFEVLIQDYKLRNILYKKLDENDRFMGKKLMDYDYWKYTIGENVYYIPRPDYLIKFADFDDWKSQSFTSGNKEANKINQNDAVRLAEKFKKPDNIDESKILEFPPV